MARKKKPVRLVPKRWAHDPWYYQITGEPQPGPAAVLQWRSRADAVADVDTDVVPRPADVDGDEGAD
jgi:hypothetical protein